MSKTKKKKKHPAPAAQPTEKRAPADCPVQPPRTAKLMGALCYLNVLILIPACSRWRHDDFVKFHLNQGLVLLVTGILVGMATSLVGMLFGLIHIGLRLCWVSAARQRDGPDPDAAGGRALSGRAGADPARPQSSAAGRAQYY